MNAKILSILEVPAIPASGTVTSLHRGEAVSIKAGGTTSLYCVSGRLWATLDGNGEDILLGSGQSLVLEGRGRLVIEALDDARFCAA